MRYAGQTDEAPLTAKQREQLLALRTGGALSRETAKGPFDRLDYCSPLVVGALQSRGLADSRVARAPGGSQVTLYWLTERGAAAAGAIASA